MSLPWKKELKENYQEFPITFSILLHMLKNINRLQKR